MAQERPYNIEVYSTPSSFPYQESSAAAYHDAFLEGVWKEDLSREEIDNRLESALNKPGFEGVWFVSPEGEVVGISWFDSISLESLEKERGRELREFAETNKRFSPNLEFVWHRETIVNPKYQGRGISNDLKDIVDGMIQERATSEGHPIMVMTRMREDNERIIKANVKRGFINTNLSVPCSLNPEKNHYYWVRQVTPLNG